MLLMVSLMTYIPRMIEVIAFIFLVAGLYRMWKSKPLNANG